MVAIGSKQVQRKETDTMTTKNANSGSKTPTHLAYQVRDAKDGKGYWTKIGAAWAHIDGQGFNIQLDSVPLDGRITLRVATDKKD